MENKSELATNPSIRTIDVVRSNDPKLKAQSTETFLKAKKNIDILNGLLAYQINHDNLTELMFYLGQISNNMYLISQTKILVSTNFNLCKNACIKYLFEIGSKLIEKPKIMNDIINGELNLIIQMQDEVDELDRLLSKRSDYIRTLISAKKQIVGSEYFTTVQTQK